MYTPLFPKPFPTTDNGVSFQPVLLAISATLPGRTLPFYHYFSTTLGSYNIISSEQRRASAGKCSFVLIRSLSSRRGIYLEWPPPDAAFTMATRTLAFFQCTPQLLARVFIRGLSRCPYLPLVFTVPCRVRVKRLTRRNGKCARRTFGYLFSFF